MNTQMVLFAIGPDKPGLVKEITAVIHESGGNLEDSRMASLAGDFALIVLFSGNNDAIDSVKKRCAQLESKLNITTQFKISTQKTDTGENSDFQFEATGHDQPGIVSRLSQVFADNGANLVSLETSLFNLAFAGTPMFRVNGQVSVPSGADIAKLRELLENVCDDMELLLEFTACQKI